MRPSIVRVIYWKELLETFRDRKTLLRVIVLPLLVYPLLMLAVSRFVSSDLDAREQRASKVAVWGAIPAVLEEELDGNKIQRTLAFHGASDELRKRIESGELRPVAAEAPKRAARSSDLDEESDPRAKTEPANPVQEQAKKLVASKEVDAVLVAWPGLVDALAKEDGAAPVTIYFDSVEENSDKAEARIVRALAEAKRRVVANRREGRGLGRTFDRPIEVEVRNVASQERRSGQVLGLMMPYMLLIMAMLGAMYPAIDFTAGEKERGTMQTLLCAPLRPIEIVLGKFLAVWTISAIAAIVNVVSMALTAKNALPGDVKISAGAYVLAMLMTLPISALLSATFVALAAFAKDFKDAQNVVMPMMLPLTFSGMLVLLPQIKLDPFLAFVPLLNVELLVKAAFAGEATPELAFLVIGAATIYAALALVAGARVFEREHVLLGGGSPFKALFAKRDRAAPPPEASPSNALFAISVALVAVFYASAALARFGTLVQVLIVQALLFAPTLGAFGLRFPMRSTFGLRAPSARGLLGGLVIGLSGAVVVTAVSTRLVPVPEKVSRELSEALLLGGKPLWVLLLVVAALPAFVEELLFRGFVYPGLRRLGVPAGIVLSSLLFGFAHGSIYRMLPTFSLGVLLAYTRERTRSILPGMVLHAVNNGLALTLLFTKPAFVEAAGTSVPLSWAAAGAVALAAGLWLVRGGAPADDPPARSPA